MWKEHLTERLTDQLIVYASLWYLVLIVVFLGYVSQFFFILNFPKLIFSVCLCTLMRVVGVQEYTVHYLCCCETFLILWKVTCSASVVITFRICWRFAVLVHVYNCVCVICVNWCAINSATFCCMHSSNRALAVTCMRVSSLWVCLLIALLSLGDVWCVNSCPVCVCVWSTCDLLLWCRPM